MTASTNPQFLVFTYAPSGGESPDTTDVVFWCSPHVTEREVSRLLATRYRDIEAPDRFLLLAPTDCQAQLEAVLADDEVAAQIAGLAHHDAADAVRGALFDSRGHVTAPTGPPVVDDDMPAILRTGLRSVFADGSGMLDPLGLYHFSKPSDTHSDRFIRTANALRRGIDTEFAALALLRQWPDGPVRVLYTDSASINSLAFAAVGLRRRLGEDDTEATIDSFGGYEGLDGFRPARPEQTLCLISASTAAALALEVAARGVPEDRIVTVFYGGDAKPGDQLLLCDLVNPPGPDAIVPIANHPEADCPLCGTSPAVVPISGDQFLTVGPATHEYTITINDAPHDAVTIAEATVGRTAVRSAACAQPDRRHEVVLDIAKILASDEDGGPLADAWKSMLERHIPPAATRVVALPDGPSRLLAKQVLERLPEGQAQIVSSRDIVGACRHADDVVVVAAIARSGRELAGVSRDLRQASPRASIAYLVGAALPVAESAWEKTRKSLRMGPPGGQPHTVATAVVAAVPDDTSDRNPFRREEALLNRLLADTAGSSDLVQTLDPSDPEGVRVELRAAVEARLDALAAGEPDGLLLPAPPRGADRTEQQLALTEGFAFWRSFGSPPNGTQADVYLTTTATLHALRAKEAGHGLVTHPQLRTVLAADNFDRYSDGVIQACLLRATRGTELNYRRDPTRSGKMTDLVRNVLSTAGDAATEFILALATGHLLLDTPDQEALLRDFAREIGTPDGRFGLLGRAYLWTAAQNLGSAAR